MPRIERLLETALYVANKAKSVAFYETVFGFATIFEEDRLTALNVLEQNILLLFTRGQSSGINETPGGTIPPHDCYGRSHLAFGIEESELSAWREHLATLDIAIESEVRSVNGSRSLYFRDPDGHLLEVGTRGLWKIY